MMNKTKNKSAFGMVGLGTMGSNLLQNIADQGYTCSGYDNDQAKVANLNQLNRDNIIGFSTINDFVDSLKSPKTIMLLVPAGPVVDIVINDLLKNLQEGDILIDGGNSHFTDTERRYKDLKNKGFHFIGMGVSGGEEGARKGPSMMPGGDEQAYETVRPILEKIAAQVHGEPTVAYMGKGAAGHFVKMVHNGIEYAIMQLLSETYEVLNKGLQLEDAQIHEVFKSWNEGRLQSYLVEITRDIFSFKNPGESQILLHQIKDQAKAKGTGKWTSQAAMDLGVPVPLIDIAVSMRDLSRYKALRSETSIQYPVDHEMKYTAVDTAAYLDKLEQAFFFSMVSAYAQGMHLLQQADKDYNYHLDLGLIAKIWRGGCIIRSAFLDAIYKAYKANPDLEHLFLDAGIHKELIKSVPETRSIVSDAVSHGIAIPAYATALGYFENLRNETMPTNLIQAQRDYFGSHTYELKDKAGVFHTEWQKQV